MPNITRSFNNKTEQEIKCIIDGVCKRLELSSECVMGRYGSAKCFDARYILVKLIKEKYPDLTNIYIGLLFKRNNHLFAFQSELKCNELLKVNKAFREKYKIAITKCD